MSERDRHVPTHANRGRSGLLLVVAVTALFALVIAGCTTTKADPPASETKSSPAVLVETTTPTRGDVIRRIDVVATLDPWKDAVLFAKTSGYLTSIRVDRGDRVRKGELLAVLDIPEVNDEYKRIEAEGERDQAEVEKSRADVRLQQLTLRRLQAVQAEEPGATTPQALDEASGKLDAARSAETAAEARLAATRAERERLTSLLAYSRIVAPFDGVVTERDVDPGALITAGTQSKPTPIVTIVNASKLRAMVDVPERDVASLAVGRSARLRVDAHPDRTFVAAVSRFSGALDPKTRTMRTEVLVENKDGLLAPGMFGRISLDLERRANVLTLPPTGLHYQKDQAYVFVADSDRARQINVQIGADDGTRVEIRSGLAGGESVIVKASEPLVDGTSITRAPTTTSAR
ncbi:MAG: efflux RND transporter periplasmic adaptor subunit [Acidobacteria bacterium]|nr:efflux RND transporter periplasmic adaptor subunit [Acidobacteriota bacterium]